VDQRRGKSEDDHAEHRNYESTLQNQNENGPDHLNAPEMTDSWRAARIRVDSQCPQHYPRALPSIVHIKFMFLAHWRGVCIATLDPRGRRQLHRCRRIDVNWAIL
jgi:hypothetical protein